MPLFATLLLFTLSKVVNVMLVLFGFSENIYFPHVCYVLLSPESNVRFSPVKLAALNEDIPLNTQCLS